MKKILVFIFVFNSICYGFSATAELSFSTAFAIPVDDENCMIRDSSTLKYNYGLRINSSSTTATANASLSAVEFSDLYSWNLSDFLWSQKYTYGLAHSEKAGGHKFCFFAGTLKFSGAINRLKNPSLSCPSPLASQLNLTPGISPALPSASSAETPLAGTFVLCPDSSKSFLPVLQLAFLKSGEKYGSIYKKISNKIFPELLISCSGGTFFHEYNKETGWFQNESYYVKSDYFSGETSVSVLFSNLKNTFSVGLYENPFGGTRRWIKNQSSVSAGFFSLGVYFFDADRDIITASGNKLQIARQLFVSPQLHFMAGKGKTTVGISAGETSRKANKRISKAYNQYYLKSGISWTSFKFSVKANYDLDYSTDTMKQNKACGLTFGIPLASVQTRTAFNYSVSKETSKTYKITEKIIFSKKILDSISSAWNWTQSEDSSTWNFNINAAFSKKTKKLKMTGKINFIFRKLS